MEVLLALGLGFLFLASLYLPWVHRIRIQELREEIYSLKSQVRGVYAVLEKEGLRPPDDSVGPQEASSRRRRSAPLAPQASPVVSKPVLQTPTRREQSRAVIKDSPDDECKDTVVAREGRVSFEQQLGARLPVWIGGVALALAGFFMVKHSIETGLLSPVVRVVLGLIFGTGLLYAANRVRAKETFANGARIAQALSGAGIADLYVCVFAATSLYDLVPAFVGFSGMALVTAAAVVLSSRHGMPIALLGLAGGFLTPAMVGSNDPQAPILFTYLYFVLAGLMAVIRKRRWWPMAIPTLFGAFVWVCLWLFGDNFKPGDSIYLGLFLMAVSATMVAASRQGDESVESAERFEVTYVINQLALCGAMLLTGVIAARAGFGFMEWSLFGLLSLGGICLAFFNPKIYDLVPWASMAVNAVMLATWDAADANALALTISLFGALYIGCGYLLQSRSQQPLAWAGLAASAGVIYYFIGYYELRDAEPFVSVPMFWGSLALVFAAFSAFALYKIIQDVPADHPRKQSLTAIYASAGSAFLCTALTIELPRDFLSVAFAAQMFAMAWINTKVDVKALRYIVGALACVFGFLLAPQILLLVQLALYSLVEARLALQQEIPIVNWPAFQLGFPALFFAAGAYLLRSQEHDRLASSLEIAAVALIGVMGYYLARHIFHGDQNVIFVKADFFERGVITNILFVYGLACLWIGRKYLRQAVNLSGLALCCVALFRIVYFDLIVYNPLWSAQTVGQLPIFNALTLTYCLPMLWTWKATKELSHAGKPQWNKYGYSFGLLLAFTWLSLSVRQLFHGAYLNGAEAANAEIYAYSVAWILLGVALLLFGTFRKDKMARGASLAIMIVSVGKAFLYDSSELDGLLRVFSFFGLGLSLLGLSWFYARFVFGDRETLEGARN